MPRRQRSCPRVRQFGDDVTFWNPRRGLGSAAASGTAALALTGTDLAPIELYTADARIVGWIAANGQRVTDLLNDQDELRLWRPHPGPAQDSLEPTSARDPAPIADDQGEWSTLVTDQLILAMPPEWRAARQLRLHRKLRRVALSAGPFSVTGNLHLPPNGEPGHDVLAERRFLPLTDAYILHSGDPAFEHVVSVVIVNTAHVTQLIPLITLA